MKRHPTPLLLITTRAWEGGPKEHRAKQKWPRETHSVTYIPGLSTLSDLSSIVAQPPPSFLCCTRPPEHNPSSLTYVSLVPVQQSTALIWTVKNSTLSHNRSSLSMKQCIIITILIIISCLVQQHSPTKTPSILEGEESKFHSVWLSRLWEHGNSKIERRQRNRGRVKIEGSKVGTK